MRQAVRRPQEQFWSWRDYQGEMALGWAREEPEHPERGQSWFDPRSRCLYVWDGSSWDCVHSD